MTNYLMKEELTITNDICETECRFIFQKLKENFLNFEITVEDKITQAR